MGFHIEIFAKVDYLASEAVAQEEESSGLELPCCIFSSVTVD